MLGWDLEGSFHGVLASLSDHSIAILAAGLADHLDMRLSEAEEIGEYGDDLHLAVAELRLALAR